MKQDKYVAALVRELTGYRASGLDERAEEVQAELDRVTGKATAPAKRAERRVKTPNEKRG